MYDTPDLTPIPFVLTKAEKSKAAWARIAIEHHVRDLIGGRGA